MLCSLSRAAELQPVLKLDAAGGQVLFSDQNTRDLSFSNSAAATGDWLFAEGIAFSPGDILLPQFSGQYARRNQLTSIAGGSIQTSQTMDNTVGLRWIYDLGDNWKVKPNFSFKSELIAQNNSEALGAGLFDLHQEQGGVEFEWNGEDLKSLRQSISGGKTQYYHYDPRNSPLFGLELLTGRQVLDIDAIDYQAAADYQPWKDGLLTGTLDLSRIEYPNQIVFQGLVPTTSKRVDWLWSTLLGLTQKWTVVPGERPVDLSASLTGGFAELVSNQNDVDIQSPAGQASVLATGNGIPNSDYYSYTEYSIGPMFSLASGAAWRATLGYNFARRDYRDRPVQDGAGQYVSDKIRTETHTLTISGLYMLTKNWSVQASAGYVRAFSNTGFQNFYLYSYNFPYYFLGFGYAL